VIRCDRVTQVEAMSSSEGAAVTLLKRAVELDLAKRYTESLVCYKEGLQLFLEVVKDITEKEKKAKYRAKAGEYLDRSEKVQEIVTKEKALGKYQEHYRIEANSTGHGLWELFGRFLEAGMTWVRVEDPYIRAHHQIINFLRLSELCVRECSSLTSISLLTSRCPQQGEEQEKKLAELGSSLKTRGVTLNVEYSSTLHDRQVTFSSGWVIKIGRGLDIFKPPEGKIVLGAFDLSQRKCLETTVDIFFQKK